MSRHSDETCPPAAGVDAGVAEPHADDPVDGQPSTPPLPSLREFDLTSDGGRMAFLWTLWESHQESGLLMAAQHVWQSLPASHGARMARTRQMAVALGLPRGGRRGVFEVLRRFLHEANHQLAMDDLPPREAYGDFAAWNADALAVFDRFHTAWEQLARRYEAVLDGRPPALPLPPQPRHTALILPWPSSPGRKE